MYSMGNGPESLSDQPLSDYHSDGMYTVMLTVTRLFVISKYLIKRQLCLLKRS